jgi:hypothetical protein
MNKQHKHKKELHERMQGYKQALESVRSQLPPEQVPVLFSNVNSLYDALGGLRRLQSARSDRRALQVTPPMANRLVEFISNRRCRAERAIESAFNGQRRFCDGIAFTAQSNGFGANITISRRRTAGRHYGSTSSSYRYTYSATLPHNWNSSPAETVQDAFNDKFVVLCCEFLRVTRDKTGMIASRTYKVRRATFKAKAHSEECYFVNEDGYATLQFVQSKRDPYDETIHAGWGTCPDSAEKACRKVAARAARDRLLEV